jgi:SAM-dependent methyltransferase
MTLLASPVAARAEAYWTRYYRDALGLSDWRALVTVRLDDTAYEQRRLGRLESALGATVSGRALLNVGCGTGGLNAVAEAAGAMTWGVDADEDAVAIARARGLRVATAEAEALPFPDGAFSVVYCYSTLEHVRDGARSIAEMVRVLRPGGLLYLHTPNRWAAFETHYKLFYPPGLPRWAGGLYMAVRGRPSAFLATLRLRSLGECRALLDRAGADVVRVLDGEANRPVGSRLWPAIRAYYRVTGIRPSVELLARRRAA